MKKRVVVAMSGGVDSSVSALLLKEQGYEVVGMTMCFNLASANRKRPVCCGLEGIEDSRRIAHKLGIKHYVVNMRKALEEKIIRDFCSEYLKGRTPNPCVRCNQYLKFDALLKKAQAADAPYFATGHYARITPNRYGFELRKAKDLSKDQSYFLYRLKQNQLKHILFPVGDYTKAEVREMAHRFGLAVAGKKESQEICFLPQDDYRPFLKAYLKKKIKPGEIVDKEGNILGQHKGIAFYTIGQREGLGIAWAHRLYITAINHRKNQIIVGAKEEAFKKEFLVTEPSFILPPPKKRVVLMVRIRYNHKEAPAYLQPVGDKIKVVFKNPQFAITPGQSAVFYDRDSIVGGGIIDEVSECGTQLIR